MSKQHIKKFEDDMFNKKINDEFHGDKGYFKKLIDGSIEVEENDDVKRELESLKPAIDLFDRAQQLGLVSDRDASLFGLELVPKVTEIYDTFVDTDPDEGGCTSCEVLGLIMDDTIR